MAALAAAAASSAVACRGETRCVADDPVPASDGKLFINLLFCKYTAIFGGKFRIDSGLAHQYTVPDAVAAAAERPDFMSFAMNSETQMKHISLNLCLRALQISIFRYDFPTGFY